MIAALAAAVLALQPGVGQSFESMSTLPPDWKLVEYTAGASTAALKTGNAADGRRFLRLSASRPNHTRLLIPVSVEPKSTYRFSVMVRASAPKPVPAVLALDGSDGITTGSIPGDGQWHERDLYVGTGKVDTVNLVLSLGWFGDTVAGDADYDDLQFEKVDSAPTGAVVAGAIAPAVMKHGPHKAIYPLAVILLALVAACGRVLLRPGRVAKGEHVVS